MDSIVPEHSALASVISKSELNSAAVLERLNAETSLSVNLAIARFAYAAPPPDTNDLAISNNIPTLFNDPADFDRSYKLWLLLPVPSYFQLSALREALAAASKKAPGVPLSIEIVSGSHLLHVPTWTLDLWPRLRTITQRSNAWLETTDSLTKSAKLGGVQQQLSLELISCLSTLAVDSAIPGLSHLRTSDLPDPLRCEWLSDEHINAGGEFINAHPGCKRNLRVLSSFFIGTLRLAFERDSTWSPRHPIRIDSLVSDGSISQLLIPVNRPSHWALLFIDVPSWTYSYADTLEPMQTSAPQSCIGLLDRWLTALFGQDIILSPSQHPFPLNFQEDSHSCGVAVLSNMAAYAIPNATQFPFWTQETATEHHLRWGLHFALPSIVITRPVGPFAFDVNLEDLEDDAFNAEAPFDAVKTTSKPIDSACQTEPTRFPIHSTRLKQSTLPFKVVAHEEWHTWGRKQLDERRAEKEEVHNQQQLLATQNTFNRRERERLRKRAQRERQKGARQALDLESPPSRRETSKGFSFDSRLSLATLETRQRISASTRPLQHRANVVPGLHQTRNAPTQRINWCAPLIWSQIESAAQAVGFPWRPIDIVRRLQQSDPHLFSLLRPQRISQWRDHMYPNELRWTQSHMRAIEAGNRPFSGTKQQGILASYPHLTACIKARLCDLRKAGVPLDIATIRGYMVGVLQHEVPEIFTQTGTNGKGFRCSERFTRRFLRESLGWSVRKATRAAQKYPSNLNTVLLHAFLRFACVVRDECVPACCIVNADQTQVVYTAGSHSTWGTTGERQVQILGLEEKRAFTLLVGASISGKLLPFQAIYSGRTTRSLPEAHVPGYRESQHLGFRLEYSGNSTYWSTFQTMCNYVSNILAPYFTAQKLESNLPETQRCIFQVDCWSVHRSDRFRTWMHDNYPWIVILYVPGGCTGLFQACDVGLQRILKLAIRRAAHTDVVNETLAALQSGTSPGSILNDQGRATLRNRSVNWIMQGHRAINQPEIVKTAFKLCAVPETVFNLSYESLTSHDARQAILQLRTTNPQVYMEITSGTQFPITTSTDGGEEEQDAMIHGDICGEDDAEQSVNELRAHLLWADSANQAAEPLDVTQEDVEDAMGVVLGVPVPEATPSQALRRSTRLAGARAYA